MFCVYEVFKSDGKRFLRFCHPDRFTCECWCRNEGSVLLSVLRGRAYLVIE